MLRGTIAGVFGLAAFGCGAEPSYVEFAEICGEAGPVRVRVLGPGERLNAPPWQFGDRMVYAVGRATAEDAKKPTPSSQMPMTVWTTGPCGEAPRRIAEGVAWAFMNAQWPGVLLACDAAAGELLVLDPEGGAPPHVLAGMDCSRFPLWTAHGLVSVTRIFEGEVDTGLATLQLHRFPGDVYREPAQTVTLLDRVRTLSRTGQPVGQMVRVFPEFLLAVTPEDELVRVDLDGGAVTVVQTGVAAFESDYLEGRYVLWQDLTPTNDDPDRPAGKLFLRDRGDSSEVFVGEGVLAYSWGALRYIDRGVFFLDLVESIRMFSLSDLGFTDLPRLGRINMMIDERRVLMEKWRALNVVDLVSGAVTTLYDGVGQIDRYREDGVEVLVLPVCCAGENTWRDEGRLWFIPYEGTARQLAARATRFGQTLPDGRRADMVDIGADWRGVLQLSDPETGEALRIDEGVFARPYVAGVFGDDVVVYSIPRGERAGVWIARMPPASQDE
ncbi:MAG: hypothetical protein H0T76_17300 [Nannocystis sp.]|nr:hypothetical protein [Nannocystis sp.]